MTDRADGWASGGDDEDPDCWLAITDFRVTLIEAEVDHAAGDAFGENVIGLATTCLREMRADRAESRDRPQAHLDFTTHPRKSSHSFLR